MPGPLFAATTPLPTAALAPPAAALIETDGTAALVRIGNVVVVRAGLAADPATRAARERR